MTGDDLRQLVDYNYWARDRVLGAVAALTAEQFTRPLGSSFSSVRDTLVHAHSAEWVWHQRCVGQSPAKALAPEDVPDLATLTAAWRDTEVQWRGYAGGLDAEGHLREIEYRQFNGQPARSPLWAIVQHVVNHGTYHRGQVTTLLRQLGAKGVGSDLIVYFRERKIAG